MVQLGIVGLASFYGPRYAMRAAERPDTTVAAVVPGSATDDELEALSRPTRDEFAEVHDCQVFETIEEMVAAVDLDAVVVSSRLDRRPDHAVRLLRSGLPVLLGKPSAGQAAAVARVDRVSREVDLPAVSTTPMRFDDALREVKDRIRQGDIGNVLRVEVSIQHHPIAEKGIQADPEVGPEQAGTVYSKGYYAADGLMWLCYSEPQRVYAEFANQNTPHMNHPDLGTGTVRFENGTLGTMTMTLSTDIRELHQWEVEVVGSEGILTSNRTGYVGHHWRAGRDRPEAFGRVLSPVLDRQFDTFVNAVTTNAGADAVEPVPTTVERSLALCSAWERAAELEEPVTLDGDGDST